MMNDKVVREILDDRARATVRGELSELVNEGLLNMGVNDEGETIFWATPLGETVLGMEQASISA
jgi:hypothetical protein